MENNGNYRIKIRHGLPELISIGLDLFRNPRSHNSRNVLFYIRKERIDEDGDPVDDLEFNLALALSQMGYDVIATTKPDSKSALNADIILDGISSENVANFNGYDDETRIIRRSSYSQDVQTLASGIDQNLKKLKEDYRILA